MNKPAEINAHKASLNNPFRIEKRSSRQTKLKQTISRGWLRILSIISSIQLYLQRVSEHREINIIL